MSPLLACYVDGQPAEVIPVYDRGLQYGDGIFTTVAVKSGVPLLWDRHLRRLQTDAARLSIALPAVDLLQADAERACANVTSATLKIILTRGSTGRGYRASATAPTRRILSLWQRAPQPQPAADGVVLRLCRTRLSRNPALAGTKHLNRLEQVVARSEWDDDYAEGLMQDTEGAIIEGTATNLFVVRDGALLTPDLSFCGVAGVMRGVVLERARGLNIANRVEPLAPAAVDAADELFLTNCLIGIWPVRRFQAKEYRIGPITRTFQAAIAGDHDGA